MSRPLKFRLRARTEQRQGRNVKRFVIQERFRLFWLLPLWFDTNISGTNSASLYKVVTKMNRSS